MYLSASMFFLHVQLSCSPVITVVLQILLQQFSVLIQAFLKGRCCDPISLVRVWALHLLMSSYRCAELTMDNVDSTTEGSCAMHM